MRCAARWSRHEAAQPIRVRRGAARVGLPRARHPELGLRRHHLVGADAVAPAPGAEDFNRANERAFQIGATYDFAGLGIHGLSVRGSGAIDSDTGAPLTQNTEFDLGYEFASEVRPDRLKPLALRGRAGLVQETLNGRPSASNEYRLILSYEVQFRGGKRR
jgi:hypothetical protein